jgi:hypothetical protein
MISPGDPDFERQMRIGTLAVTAALGVAALLAGRPRVRAAAEIGPPTPMVVSLEILERGRRRSYQARPPFVVGRASAADVMLKDGEASRRHARFDSRDGVVYVEDLRSRNGTFLNGNKVTEAVEVREGDAIDVGATRVLVTEVRPG